MYFKERFIINFFLSRGWIKHREGKLFTYLKPPKATNLPEDYLIEIPKDDQVVGFDKYISNLICTLDDLLPNEANRDDLRILFSKENSILKYRIFDSDTKNGSIKFTQYIDSLDSFKRILTQAVTFTVSKKPIFGEAKTQVSDYLNHCRALQTEKGSFITKFEIPSSPIYSTFETINTYHINNKLFDVLEFVESEVFYPSENYEVSENYLADNSKYLNYELLNSIKDLYSRTKVNNVEYQLNSNSYFRKVITEKAQNRLSYFNLFLRNIKDILLNTVPLEAQGYVKRLASLAPKRSNRNEVFIDTEIANNRESVKIILRSEEYLEALEAHANEWPIKIKCKAKQSTIGYIISELEEFKIIRK